MVKVDYGGLDGFNRAMNLSSDVLINLRFMIEKQMLQYFFHRLRSEEGMSFLGLDDSLKQLSNDDTIATLIVWEDLEVMVRVMRDSSGRRKVEVLGVESEARDEGWTLVEKSISLVYWLATNYTRDPFRLDIVSNSTAKGMQFCKGFNGIGGLLLNKRKDDGDDSHDDDDDDDE
ncbi:PREDICTED: eukaryotic peptide chain release factor subunit 1-1-like [Camelina sativa]|uniref:Eukaryotic peptide chain release factor subunit 1-1-like n=1 Tax=Camelina sativa TaxID=90675 RepID=A0ABM0X5R6_CAMSA|nr:PREDICTED: eukaryotic peptide chain release factor subunit 1-1-like [Camelina sativa]